MSNRPLNVGLVGGGKGAFIVHPHQKAIHFDGTRRVVAGALFPDPKIALEEAANWPYPIKGYGSYDEMIAANASLPADQKLDYILIVTPNFVHYDPAMKAMKAGIAVFCEKPLCLNLKEANDLVKTARKLNVPFGVAHTYLGPLDQPASAATSSAPVCWATCAGWTATTSRAGWRPSSKPPARQQAVWRVDPKRAGGSGCGGDIGTHALMQLRYVTGLEVAQLSAQLETFVQGRHAGRPLHHLLQAQQRRQSPGARLADLHRPQERPRHRSRRHQGHARLAPGRARVHHHHAAGPARPRLLARRGHARATGSCPRTCPPT